MLRAAQHFALTSFAPISSMHIGANVLLSANTGPAKRKSLDVKRLTLLAGPKSKSANGLSAIVGAVWRLAGFIQILRGTLPMSRFTIGRKICKMRRVMH